MQADMLLLAERLVVAVERLSQDVNNISTYMYDLSYSVQYFLNEKREKENVSQFSCDEDNLPSDSPAAQSENSWRIEREDGISVSDIDDLQNKEISAEDASSINASRSENIDVLCAFTEGIKVEELSENEENYESCSGGDRTIVEESMQETDFRPDRQCAGLSSSLVTAFSSSRPPSVEATGIKTERVFLKNVCPPEHRPLFVQDFQCHLPFAVASCSSANIIMDQTATADRDLLEGNMGGQVAGVREGQSTVPRHEVTHFEKVTPESDLVDNSFEGSGREIRKKAFGCFICKKQFARKFLLLSHERQHTGERPYLCSQCGKSFMAKRVLRTHMKFHKSERPYKCSECERAFVQKCDLAKHMRTHTGQRPFKCEECGKSFARKDAVTDHMSLHSASRPFVCTECGKHYKSVKQLAQHTRYQHGAASAVP